MEWELFTLLKFCVWLCDVIVSVRLYVYRVSFGQRKSMREGNSFCGGSCCSVSQSSSAPLEWQFCGRNSFKGSRLWDLAFACFFSGMHSNTNWIRFCSLGMKMSHFTSKISLSFDHCVLVVVWTILTKIDSFWPSLTKLIRQTLLWLLMTKLVFILLWLF